MDSCLLGGFTQLFKLLPNALGYSAQPFSRLAIHLMRDALQLFGYPLLLCLLPLIVGRNASCLGYLALFLGALPSSLGMLVVWGAVFSHSRTGPQDSLPCKPSATATP